MRGCAPASANRLAESCLLMDQKIIKCASKEEFFQWAERLRQAGEPDHEVVEWLQDNDGMGWRYRIEGLTVTKRCHALPPGEPQTIIDLLLGKEMTISLADFDHRHVAAMTAGLKVARGPLKDALYELVITLHEIEQYEDMLEREDPSPAPRPDYNGVDDEPSQDEETLHTQPVDMRLIRSAEALVEKRVAELKYPDLAGHWRYWRKQYIARKVSRLAIEEFKEFIGSLTRQELRNLCDFCIYNGSPLWLPSELRPAYRKKYYRRK